MQRFWIALALANAALARPPTRVAAPKPRRSALQRDPDHFGARSGGERSDDAAVDAARHGNDNARTGPAGTGKKIDSGGHFGAPFTR